MSCIIFFLAFRRHAQRGTVGWLQKILQQGGISLTVWVPLMVNTSTFAPHLTAAHTFITKKRTHSIVLMAVADANYEFIYVDVGTNGRVSDGGVWGNCKLFHSLNDNTAGLPADAPLPGSNRTLPFVFVGDDAFPPKTYFLKPFPFRDQSREERIFSYRLSRARRTVENAFGILANRFRVLQSAIDLSPKKAETVVLACTALHNLLRRQCASDYNPPGSLDTENEVDGTLSNGTWRQGQPLLGLEAVARKSSFEAKLVREEFKHYFNQERSIPWQNLAAGIDE